MISDSSEEKRNGLLASAESRITGTGTSSTVTRQEAEYSPAETVTLAVPTLRPVIVQEVPLPEASTTLSLLLDQVTSPLPGSPYTDAVSVAVLRFCRVVEVLFSFTPGTVTWETALLETALSPVPNVAVTVKSASPGE